MFKYSKRVSLTVLIAFQTLVACGEANALTGQELVESFDARERYMYVAGLADMASYQATLQGNSERAQCIVDWFHHSDGEAMLQVQQLLEYYPDRHAQPIVVVMINRACPNV